MRRPATDEDFNVFTPIFGDEVSATLGLDLRRIMEGMLALMIGDPRVGSSCSPLSLLATSSCKAAKLSLSLFSCFLFPLTDSTALLAHPATPPLFFGLEPDVVSSGEAGLEALLAARLCEAADAARDRRPDDGSALTPDSDLEWDARRLGGAVAKLPSSSDESDNAWEFALECERRDENE